MRKQLRHIIPLLLAAALLLTGACSQQASAGNSVARDDMRAVWVSTVYNLDYPTQATTDAAQLKAQADQILQDCAEMGMNAVILQVRPTADALYPSELFPWSRYLTGGQDKAPSDNFDPLAYWVSRAHALGLELHAWINPYRITRGGQSDYDALSASSPAKQHPEWVVQYENNYYFDPALPEVRELVIQGVEEICRSYDVDGIHLDDYFYPGSDFADDASFAAYGAGFASRDDWRRDNVNQLVQALGERIHAIDPELSYGISPSGVWADRSSLPEGSDTTGGYESYFSAYADSRKWVKEGWVDYICPQVYWYIGHSSMDYETIVRWWADTVRGTGVRLYIGMADYQACNPDASSPWYGTAAIQAQLDLNDSISEVSGEVHFRYRFLVDNAELQNLYISRYAQGGGTSTAPTPSATPTPTPTPAPVQAYLDTQGDQAYVQGSDGRFMPEAALSRAEAVTILARLSVDEGGQPLYDGAAYTGGFSDVTADQWYAPYIAFAQTYGIASGYTDGSFRPEQSIGRAELVKLLCAFETGGLTAGADGFSDVSSSHWASAEIAHAAAQGWISGYPDGTFRPDQPITRCEAVRVINAALGRVPVTDFQGESPFSDVEEDHWAYGDILAAAGL